MTTIEWADVTWNPVTGCTKVSAGCKNCYAERMALRLNGRFGYPKAPNHFDVTLHPDRLNLPLRWRKSRRVFVCSMGDLFHERLSWSVIERVFMTMTRARQHRFMVLTKRAKRMREFVTRCFPGLGECSPHIWGMVTVENQEEMWRVEELLQTPFAVRGVSCEPLLGLIDVAPYLKKPFIATDEISEKWNNSLDWIIVGGESGPGARRMHPEWLWRLRDQCQAAGVPFFFKQWGRWAPALTMLHKLGVFFYADGYTALSWDGGTYHNRTGASVCYMAPFGKKAAGRLMAGREWNEVPADHARTEGRE